MQNRPVDGNGKAAVTDTNLACSVWARPRPAASDACPDLVPGTGDARGEAEAAVYGACCIFAANRAKAQHVRRLPGKPRSTSDVGLLAQRGSTAAQGC